MGANTGAPEPVDLFTFLRTVEVAAARKKLTRQQAAVGRLVAYDSSGTTGGGVVVNDEKVAIELGLSSRQVWRHFKALVDAGWFVQTTAPTRGLGASPGRRAKYQCTTPVLDLGLMTAADLPPVPDQLPFPEPAELVDKPPSRLTVPRSELAHETPDNRLTVPSADSATDSSTPAESSDSFGNNRLTVSEESSDTAERENGTHSPSGGTPADGYPPTPVPQQPKPQDAREPVDKPSVEKQHDDRWDRMNAEVRARMAAAFAPSPRHARPTPPPQPRPDRE